MCSWPSLSGRCALIESRERRDIPDKLRDVTTLRPPAAPCESKPIIISLIELRSQSRGIFARLFPSFGNTSAKTEFFRCDPGGRLRSLDYTRWNSCYPGPAGYPGLIFDISGFWEWGPPSGFALLYSDSVRAEWGAVAAA